MKEFLSKLRKDYSLMGLSEKDLHESPFTQFENWLIDVANAGVSEPNAMVLSTLDKEGYPQGRIVLLRNFNQKGFVFYTNYNSEKGNEILQHPKVSLNFFWVDLERQVRITGDISKISVVESNEYFNSRPRLNQISAWASPQSEVITSRTILDNRVKELEEEFKNQDVIPKPPFWGGYCVSPVKFEFWQGRPNRLHDRFRYSKLSENKWKIERLAP